MKLEDALALLQTDPEQFLQKVIFVPAGSPVSGEMEFVIYDESDNILDDQKKHRDQRFKVLPKKAYQGGNGIVFKAHNVAMQSITDSDVDDIEGFMNKLQWCDLPFGRPNKLMITGALSGCCILYDGSLGNKIAHIKPPSGTTGIKLHELLKIKYPRIRMFGRGDYENASSVYVVGVLLSDGWNFFKQEYYFGSDLPYRVGRLLLD